jgi:PAS domain S-box-containing protein
MFCRNTFQAFFILFCLFSNVISLANTEQNDKITLQLQWKHQFEFAGFYAAKEKGFYDEVGLDVEFVEFQSKNIVDEVLKGNADYGLTYSTLIAQLMEDKPLVFLANFFKQSPLVLVTQKEIKTPKDLQNKKVMGLLDSTHKHIFLEMLDRFNLSPDDFTNIPRRFTLDSFINKEIDAVSVFSTNEIFTLNQKGIQYNVLDPAVYGVKFYDINLFTTQQELQNNPQRVKKFRDASIKGWEYALSHQEELVDIILKKYNTQNKSKEALLFEAKQIEYLMLANIYPVGSIDLDQVKVISDSFAQSLKIQKKSRKELKSFIYDMGLESFNLTQKQKAYLKKKKVLKMCIDPSWMPLEKIEEGEHVGISSEYMDIIAQKLNIPIQLVITQSWTQSLQKIKNNECDFLPLAQKTPKRQEYLNFTKPYISIPLAVATKQGVPFSSSLGRLKDKSLAVVANYSLHELFKMKYPNLNLIEVDSVKDGLEYVDQEKVFGFIDNSMVINHEIQKSNMNDKVAITGQFSETFHLSIASRKDQPILNAIFEKTLLTIDNITKERILNKWNNISYQTVVDKKLIAQILFFTVILIGIFIYWNIKLKEEIKKKESVQKKLKESEEKFRVLFDIAPVLLDSFDENGKIVLWNKECEKVFGWSFEELENTKDTVALFYPDIEERQKVIESFQSGEYNVYKQWHPITKDGRRLTTNWANIKLPNGEVFSIGYDRTQQRKDEQTIKEKTKELELAKEELEKLNNSLEKRVQDEIQKNTEQQVILMQQSKLAQMGEMIENIAHQWRQPLAQINSTILVIDTQLTKLGVDNENIEEKLTQIESLTSYMSKTIDDFKNFFHPDKSKQYFQIKDAVENAYDVLKGRLKILNIEIAFTIQKDLQINSYKYELQQVILTLLNNAIDAIESQKISQGKIELLAKEFQNDIIITVQDNARGIQSEIVDKVFDPYFTTKHKTQGTGLGLYMAKMIIQSGFDGSLSVVNKKGGACFTIQIPKGEE